MFHRKSKFKLAMLAAFALLVAAPVAGAYPAPDEGTPDYGVNTTDYSRADFAKPNPATSAGLRMEAAAKHYGVSPADGIVVETPDYGVNTTDYSRADFAMPNPATSAGLRMQAAAEHYAPSVDLRGPDALDAAQAPVAPNAPVLAPSSGDEATLSPAGSDFPWAGLLVGLGLAGVAGLLGLIVARGSLPRPLGR